MQFNKEELKLIKKLSTPKKVQDFINSLKANFEPNGDECKSPRVILKRRTAHCIEGAILAAAILRIHGHKPLLVDLRTTKDDYEHVLAVFKQDGYWGAITKTNHAVLRYREPIYKNIRELVMSYFHEYFLDNGKKTLRSYSNPVDLNKFDSKNWITDKKDLWYIARHLDKVKHYPIINNKQIKRLRKADKIEIEAGKLTEYKRD